MVLKLDESEAFIKKAKSKLTSSKVLYEIGQYGDSVEDHIMQCFYLQKHYLLEMAMI